MATAQTKIFWLLRIYHLATAHLPIIYLLQIELLFHHWKSSKYVITLHWKILCQLHIAYLETFRRFIWLLRKNQFFGYSASYNYSPTAHLLIICLLKIEQLFHHWKSSKYLITLHRKIVKLQIAYLVTFQRFIWLLRKANFISLMRVYHFVNAHLPIIYAVQIVQVFHHWESLNNWLLRIQKFYDNFKSPILKYFDDLYGYCEMHNFWATAHHTIILLLASTKYLSTSNRQIISTLETFYIFGYSA